MSCSSGTNGGSLQRHAVHAKRGKIAGHLGFGCARHPDGLPERLLRDIATRLDIGSQDIAVTHLGCGVLSGNTGTCTVKLFRVLDMAELGSVTFNLSTGTPGGFLYGVLASPATLVAGGTYYLMMDRLLDGLARVMQPAQVGQWIQPPNPACDGSTPLQVVERGEIDRLWRMLYDLESG